MTQTFLQWCGRAGACGVVLVLAACGGGGDTAGAPALIRIDGSSTVFPISEAVAEEFQIANPGLRVTVAVSGTGGGFERFCRGETDISNASRPVQPVEIETCAANGIEFIELPIAYDGLAVVVNPANDWANFVTVDELRALWEPAAQGQVMRWSQVRASWPDREIHLYGAGVDSGTYDYFTDAITGEEGASRGDYTSSEDDNVLVQGIATDDLGLGFMGLAYVTQNQGRMKTLGVDDGDADNGDGPVVASVATVADGTYQPLSRPIFIYVSRQAAERPEVQAFVDFHLREGGPLVDEVGYIRLSDELYTMAGRRFADRQTGTIFGEGGSQVGVSLEDILALESPAP
jgi:phosphate transport system substrate-binding protein